ncbi:MAG TPA: carboxypeptidase regulatory-like domain-containing protein [Pyrinomonadaceae bacterium]|jgi:hypothetical protein
MIKTTNNFLRLTQKLFPLVLFSLAILISLSISAQAATYTVTSDADSGPGTLRQAILDANATPGDADTIDFNITPLGGVKTINLLSPLPAITGTGTGSLTINGYTQSGSSANTLPTVASNAVLTIELNGAGAGAAIGLRCSGTGANAFCVIAGLVINRFQEGGIRVDASTRGVVNGNFIGTNAAGTAALGNINYGVLFLDPSGLSGANPSGTVPGRNVISGNSGTGVTISDTATGISISSNLIGTDKTGTLDVGNTGHGILIANSDTNTVFGNIISGNNGSGVAIQQDFGFTASGNNVNTNFIGVDATGNSALGNNGSGILLQASGNFIGTGASPFRNAISGNGANGISISTNFATSNSVLGNFIGVGYNGTTSIPNFDNGVQISNGAAGNTIGDPTGVILGATPACTGGCNIIANNGNALSTGARAGIYLDSTAGAGNAIRANSIFNNTGIGIDLQATGATANDLNDPDTGANNQQNKPVINNANTAGFISGTLNSTAGTTFAIDFFRNSLPDTALTSEGRIYIGTVNCTSVSTTTCTIAGNNYAFFFTTTVPLSVGQFVTATATATGTAFAPQAVGDTSELSDAAAVVLAPPTAASVTIAGRVLAGKNRGVSNASLYLTDTDGQIRVARTNAFGYYQFTEVRAGETYIISVRHRSYQFTPQVITVNEELADVDFTPNQ